MLNKPNGRVFKRCGVFVMNMNVMKNEYFKYNLIELFHKMYCVTM